MTATTFALPMPYTFLPAYDERADPSLEILVRFLQRQATRNYTETLFTDDELSSSVTLARAEEVEAIENVISNFVKQAYFVDDDIVRLISKNIDQLF